MSVEYLQVEKSFPGHRGRPGHRGGSVSRKEAARDVVAQAAKTPQRAGGWYGVARNQDPRFKHSDEAWEIQYRTKGGDWQYVPADEMLTHNEAVEGVVGLAKLGGEWKEDIDYRVKHKDDRYAEATTDVDNEELDDLIKDHDEYYREPKIVKIEGMEFRDPVAVSYGQNDAMNMDGDIYSQWEVFIHTGDDDVERLGVAEDEQAARQWAESVSDKHKLEYIGHEDAYY